MSHLQRWWMIWLGGFCVALAGVFLVRYSIEMGLLGPAARVTLGSLLGLSLNAAAEWLRRRTGELHPAFAALAGGGSITLFATVLAALHLYAFINAGLAFLLLAAIALGTMCLAYIHGPALAAIGILGAYIVPLLVSSADGDTLFALGYSLVISASTLLLMRYVYRPWLWWGLMAGLMGWWLLSLDSDVGGFRDWYLAASAYLVLAVPGFDWRLQQRQSLPGQGYRRLVRLNVGSDLDSQLPLCMLLLTLAQAADIARQDTLAQAAWTLTPLMLVLLQAGYRRESLTAVPAFLLLAHIVAFVVMQLGTLGGKLYLQPLDGAEAGHLFAYAGVMSLLVVGLAFRNATQTVYLAVWNALLALGPVLLLALCYTLTGRFAINGQWGLLTSALAFAYLALAVSYRKRSAVESLVVWLFFAGHFALALAAVMFTRDAGLTLVLSAQMVSASWLIVRFKLPGLGWVTKLLTALIVLRLSFNPWIVGYPVDTHWSLWTFGGATLCCFFSKQLLNPYPKISRWAEGACLHLFVLTLWAELRYWLYSGNVFAQEYRGIEAGLYLLLFGALGLVYYRRSLLSEYLALIYRMYSRVLLGLALLT